MTHPSDFFRARIDAMIDMRPPLAVLATRMPWAQIEASIDRTCNAKRALGVILLSLICLAPRCKLLVPV
jgi:transposase, IS5 family